MSTLRNQLPSGIRSFVTGNGDPSTARINHVIPVNHSYVAAHNSDLDPRAKSTAKQWAGSQNLVNGRPAYSIEYMLHQGDKDPRNYLGQGYTKTQQDGAAIQQAILDAMNDPDSPIYRNIDQYAKSLMANGFQDAFAPQKRKKARNNQTNNGMGPQGNYNGPSQEVTPGLPEYQLPFYTGEPQARQQMKRNMVGDRAMENGGIDQVHTYNSRPGWFNMDKRLGIPTAAGGYNVPTFDPQTNTVQVRHVGQGFPTYMSNPNVNSDTFVRDE